MIEIDIRLDNRGNLNGFDASGHSGFDVAGKDPVCASVSVLIRTVLRVLETEPGIVLSGTSDKRGEAHYTVQTVSEVPFEWLSGITQFMVTGLRDLGSEFPENCRVSVSYV